MAGKTGVYPCYENQFQINTAGTGSTATLTNIADMVSYGVAFDNGIEEWTPYESEGWSRRLMTAKSLKITVSGKRNIGDAGNDFIAGLYSKNGRDVECTFQWAFPDGSKVVLDNAVINVTNVSAGDSTTVAPLEFEVLSNGKPTFTPVA